tara:strand:+ start:33450 stop:34019 length:570 start_codon:yes stop_codon:yes gene_type:complete
LRDTISILKVWKQFSTGGRIAETVQLGVSARLVNRNDADAIKVAESCVIRGILRAEFKGTIEIDAFVYIGDGSLLSAANKICVGEGTLIAHNVQIFDNDTHPTDAAQRVADFKKKLGIRPEIKIEISNAPVSIGKRCWIGMNSIVMKGVSIGDDTIVASGSVVVSDLPSNVVAAGNPAKPIKALDSQTR